MNELKETIQEALVAYIKSNKELAKHWKEISKEEGTFQLALKLKEEYTKPEVIQELFSKYLDGLEWHIIAEEVSNMSLRGRRKKGE